jgi:hypothetical protein
MARGNYLFLNGEYHFELWCGTTSKYRLHKKEQIAEEQSETKKREKGMR